MTPKKAFERCLQLMFACGTIRNGPYGKPGKVVERASRNPEVKEALENLRSEDLQDVRQEDLG